MLEIKKRVPTDKQKEILAANGLNPDRWMVICDDYEELVVLNARGHRHTIKKEQRDNV